MYKVAVMASGSGTILASIIEHGVPVGFVLADKQCRALDIAEAAGIPTMLVDRRDFGYSAGIGDNWDREGFTVAVAAALKGHKIDLVAMAGFFTILDPVIFREFDGWILNIHPSLLPEFKGEFAVRDALAAGVKETGSTVHIATEELDDETYILGQVKVPVMEGDTEDILKERIKVEERKLYPSVIRDILEGNINLDKVRGKI